jgi:hypothetical protein
VNHALLCAQASETRNFVVGVVNNLSTLGEGAHVQAVKVVIAIRLEGNTLLQGYIAHALQDQGLGLFLQCQRHPQSLGSALARVIVWRCTDASARKDHIT